MALWLVGALVFIYLMLRLKVPQGIYSAGEAAASGIAGAATWAGGLVYGGGAIQIQDLLQTYYVSRLIAHGELPPDYPGLLPPSEGFQYLQWSGEALWVINADSGPARFHPSDAVAVSVARELWNILNAHYDEDLVNPYEDL